MSLFPSFDDSRFHLSEDLPPIYSRFQNESFKLHNKKIIISNAAIARAFNERSKKFVDTPSQTTIKMDNFPQALKPEIGKLPFFFVLTVLKLFV